MTNNAKERHKPMSNLEYYRQQSVITDPGQHARLYDALPDDIAGICRVAQGLIVHYAAPVHSPTAERLREIDCRFMSAMLDRILELDNRPLTEARPVERRLVGCCRDITVLTVSILRHKNIPARARYGAAAYFDAGYFNDHVILEYWNGRRWVGVDSELSPPVMDIYKIDFDPLDVPEDQFLRGGMGWLMCRAGAADPDRFGLGPASPLHGWEFIVTELLLDLAALNRREMLCWDSWGIANNSLDLSEADKLFLDEIASATLDDASADDRARLFADDRLRLPPVIQSYSPAAKPEEMPLEVTLDFAAEQ